jgi:CTP synthase
MLEKAHLSDIVCRGLNLKCRKPDLSDWEHMVERVTIREKQVTIGLVGKYVELHDAYLSVAEALRHAGFYQDADIDIKWIDSETITEASAETVLGSLDGIIVPGGFGKRGIEGMITAARYARENRLPYFGICLGMQVAVIEFARNVAKIENAHSGEFAQNVPKVIDYLPDQSDQTDKGGTLRLGAYPCVLQENTVIKSAYGKADISERHRHRYEFNNKYREILQNNGLTLSGLSPDGSLVETVELSDREFYIGVQYHPEFKSRPNKPHPLFSAFIRAALRGRNES